MSLESEKYVAFTTYKKDGTPKSSPVWIADVGGGQLGFTTSSSSWKVKRLANNSSVELQPSDARGHVKEGTTATAATADVVKGAEFDRVRAIVKKKYGIQVTLISTMASFMKLIGRGSETDCAVIITLS